MTEDGWLSGDERELPGQAGEAGIFSQYHGQRALVPLIERFARELPDRLSELEMLVGEGDLAGAARRAHQLKGAASVHGFPDLAETLGLIEELSAEGAARPESPPEMTIREELLRARRLMEGIKRAYA